MATTETSVADTCTAAKRASRGLATLDTATKNRALEMIAAALEERVDEILEANPPTSRQPRTATTARRSWTS